MAIRYAARGSAAVRKTTVWRKKDRLMDPLLAVDLDDLVEVHNPHRPIEATCIGKCVVDLQDGLSRYGNTTPCRISAYPIRRRTVRLDAQVLATWIDDPCIVGSRACSEENQRYNRQREGPEPTHCSLHVTASLQNLLANYILMS